MACLVLELSKPQFPRIGALVQQGEEFAVGRRSLTVNIDELITSANVTPTGYTSTDPASSAFESPMDYFFDLAKHHLTHLRNQRNDAVTDEDDC